MIESLLCQALIDALSPIAVAPVVFQGNWLLDESGTFKGMEIYDAAKIEVNVEPRRYDDYFGHILDFRCEIVVSLTMEHDPTYRALCVSYMKIVDRLEMWQGKISRVKADLTLKNANGAAVFDPVGFRLDGGNNAIDPATGTQTIIQSFTIRGRNTRHLSAD